MSTVACRSLRTGRYPCFDLVCTVHHLPPHRCHSRCQLRQPLSQIQFKFLSGIYFGPQPDTSHWNSCHASAQPSTGGNAISRLSCAAHMTWSTHCSPQARAPLTLFSFSFFLFVIVHVECCNFNPLMDLMRVSLRFFSILAKSTRNQRHQRAGWSKLKLMTAAAAAGGVAALMLVTDTHKCVVRPAPCPLASFFPAQLACHPHSNDAKFC